MKLIIILAFVALCQAKSQVPHETYGVPHELIKKPFEKYEVPVVETEYSYKIPEAQKLVIPAGIFGVPVVPSLTVEVVKPAEEYGVPHKEYGLPLVKPVPIVETKYSYTIPEAPKVVIPAETYGVPAVPAVEYGVPASAVEIVKPAVPHEEYGLPLEEKPAPVVETNYAYTIPVEEPKPVVPAVEYGVPQKEYGLPLVEEKPYAPTLVPLPVVPHETYGPPKQLLFPFAIVKKDL